MFQMARQVFSPYEKQLLLQLIKINRRVIQNKETNKVANAEKNACWVHIAKKFNSAFGTNHKTVKQLIQCYRNNKKNSNMPSANFKTDKAISTMRQLISSQPQDITIAPANTGFQHSAIIIEGHPVIKIEQDGETDEWKQSELLPVICDVNFESTSTSVSEAPSINGVIETQLKVGESVSPRLPAATAAIENQPVHSFKQKVQQRIESSATTKAAGAIESIRETKQHCYRQKIEFEKKERELQLKEHALQIEILNERLKFMRNLNQMLIENPSKLNLNVSQNI